jgi:hypothetical protein
LKFPGHGFSANSLRRDYRNGGFLLDLVSRSPEMLVGSPIEAELAMDTYLAGLLTCASAVRTTFPEYSYSSGFNRSHLGAHSCGAVAASHRASLCQMALL